MNIVNPSKLASIGLFVLLCAFQLWFGIIPAWRSVDSDFPNYYTASKLLLTHGDVAKVYDDNWFQHQIFENGINQEGKFSPFPPTTMLVMAPIVGMDPLTALRVWTVFNILFLTVLVWQIRRLSGFGWLECANLVLLSGLALSNNFRLGQFYIVVAVAVAAGMVELKQFSSFSIRIREFAVGFGAGAVVAVKYIPILLAVPMLNSRRWNSLVGLMCGLLVTVSLTLLLTGSDVWTVFLSHILWGHINGLIQNPYAIQFQSFNALLRMLFIADPLLNPTPWISSPTLYRMILGALYSVATGLFLWVWWRTKDLADSANLLFLFIFITALTLLPASATYHFLLLILPVTLLLSEARKGNSSIPLQIIVILIMYSVIGFIPYHIFRTFYVAMSATIGPIAAIFAFPRLWLMVGIYVLGFSFIIGRIRQVNNRLPS